MERILNVAQVLAPILVTVFLGILAKRRKLLTLDQVKGLQQFVLQFGLPCLIFNSCLTARIGAESLGTMGLVLSVMAVSTFWAYRARKKQLPYHNLPQLFCAQETGMLGIPLFAVLFGADQAYRMGILDLTQATLAFPTIAILSSDMGSTPSPKEILRKVFTSPMLIMCLIALALNLTGVGAVLDTLGILPVITGSTEFLAQPVSAMMIFCAGYSFSLDSRCRSAIFRVSAIHFTMFAVFCGLIQLGLFLIPNVDVLTRWSILLFCALPGSYLAPGLGRTEEDITVASGVCSLLTVSCLVIFCIMACFVM